MKKTTSSILYPLALRQDIGVGSVLLDRWTLLVYPPERLNDTSRKGVEWGARRLVLSTENLRCFELLFDMLNASVLSKKPRTSKRSPSHPRNRKPSAGKKPAASSKPRRGSTGGTKSTSGSLLVPDKGRPQSWTYNGRKWIKSSTSARTRRSLPA